MIQGLTTAAWLGAGILFILSLGGLSTQESARRGNLFGVLGMSLAFAATLVQPGMGWLPLLPLVPAAIVGLILAKRVAMTDMPQLVAILHSFVGLAAVLVGLSSWVSPLHGHNAVHSVEIWLDVAIGALTFTGSVVAWGKLDGKLGGKPTLLPGRHFLNLALVAAIVGLAIPAVSSPETGLPWLLGMAVVAGLLGVHLVVAIGGADMPVVVSLLNSYSGWTAAAAGFMLGNDLLIVTGALVGSSGAILSHIMCQAMNRSIWNVVFGGFGADAPSSAAGAGPQGEYQEVGVAELKDLSLEARSVVIIPGYGMAVAQAQRAVDEYCRFLREKGANVRFAIHPVAGRLPGHMNVLLAEAGVPYDIVLEMDEINEDFPETDLVLVIGANDIVNPSALDDPSSPIAGMPVLECWKAKTTVVLKRGRGAGYAGIENPLFFLDNTRMYLGDARKSMEALVTALRS